MEGSVLKTTEEVRQEFRRNGISISSWARKHGFPTQAVHRVLRGNAKCWYGNAHKIAVMLGIKDGEIENA